MQPHSSIDPNIDYLNLTEIQIYIQDILPFEIESITSLAEVCLSQTDGNLVFLTHYLSHLLTSRAIFQTDSSQEWEICLQNVKEAGICTNHATLYLKTTNIEERPIKKYLFAASVFGLHSSMAKLKLILNLNETEFGQLLKKIRRLHFFSCFQETLMDSDEIVFNNKSIQEYCFNLISEIQDLNYFIRILYLVSKDSAHLSKSSKAIELLKMINKELHAHFKFDQLSQFGSLNMEFAEILDVQGEYRKSIELLNTFLNNIPGNFAKVNQVLYFHMKIKLVSLHFKDRKFIRGEKIIQEMFRNAQSSVDRAQLYYYDALFASIQRKQKKVYSIYRSAVSELMQFKIDYSKFDFKSNFHPFFIQSLENLKENLQINHEIVQDVKAEYIIKLLVVSSTQIIHLRTELVNRLFLEMIEFVNHYGITAELPSILFLLGIQIVGDKDTHKLGLWFIKKAESISEQFSITEFPPIVELLYANRIIPWMGDIRKSKMHYRRAYSEGIINENSEIAAYSLTFETIDQFSSGLDLDELYKKIPQVIALQQDLFPGVFSENILGLFMFVTNLSERTPSQEDFNTDIIQYSDYIELAKKRSKKEHAIFFRLLKGILETLYRNYEDAYLTFNSISRELHLYQKRFIYTDYIFYKSIVLLKILNNPEILRRLGKLYQKSEILQEISENFEMFQTWVEFSPMNYKSKLYLLQALLLANKKNELKAFKYLNLSILLAQKDKFIHIEALGNEFAAELCLQIENYDYSILYFEKALHLYDRWGAKRKCTLLFEDSRWKKNDISKTLLKNHSGSKNKGTGPHMSKQIAQTLWNRFHLQIRNNTDSWLSQIFTFYPNLVISIKSLTILSINPLTGVKRKKISLRIKAKPFSSQISLNDVLDWLKHHDSIIYAQIIIKEGVNLISLICENPLFLDQVFQLGISITFPIKCDKNLQYWDLVCPQNKNNLLVSELHKEKITYSILSVKPVTNQKTLSQFDLTSRQKEIYDIALKKGYFQTPKKISLSLLAQHVGISPSTISVMMKRIVNKMHKNSSLG